MTKTYNVAICATYIFAILPVHVYPFIEEEKKATFLTASVGDSVVFNCQLDFPHDVIIPYILYWKKEGKTVFSWHEGVLYASDAFEHRIGLLPSDSPYGKGSINLTSIRETDAGWYECRVLFPNRSPSSRLNGTWFHLTVDGGNLLGIPPINQTVMEGQQAHFSCVTKDSEATVTWYKDGVPLSEIPNLMGRSFISHEGSLTVRVTEMDDVGKFTCEISNKQGETQTATAFLDVQYEAKVIFSPQEKYLPHGKSAVLDCHSRANPPLKDVRWQKDGFLFDPYNVQGVFVRSNGSLYFSKVEEAHGGDYVCTPYNEIGTAGSSAPMRVIIQHPPVFTMTPHNLYLIKKGDSIEIPCDAVDGDGTHRPAIQWYKKDGSSLPTSRSFITGGNLTIANIEESDRGLYQCVATNEAATVNVETELMIENSQPRAPYNLTANSTTTSITLKWIPGYGKPQMEYSVWFRKLDVAEWRTTRIAKGANQVTINNLTPGHEYELMVLSQDQRGDGMFSKALRYKTKGPGVHKENEFKKPLETFQQIGPPLNVRVNIDVEGYKVSWDPPEFGAELLRVYTVSWYEGDNENDIVKADTSGTSFIVKDLEENKSYHFQVTAMSTNDYESSSERFTIYVPDYHRARAINIGVAVGLMLIFATAAGIWYVRNVYRRTNHKSHFDDS